MRRGLGVASTSTLNRLDQEHAAAYFQIIYDALRKLLRAALEKRIMDRQTQQDATLPPFARRLMELSQAEGMREGKLEGTLEGVLEGELKGKREALLRLLSRANLAVTEEERARIEACGDSTTLDRWLDNVVGARATADVLV